MLATRSALSGEAQKVRECAGSRCKQHGRHKLSAAEPRSRDGKRTARASGEGTGEGAGRARPTVPSAHPAVRGPRGKWDQVDRGGSSPRRCSPGHDAHLSPPERLPPPCALWPPTPAQAGGPPPAFQTQLTRPDLPCPSWGSVRLLIPVTTGVTGTPRGWGLRARRPDRRQVGGRTCVCWQRVPSLGGG